MLQTNRSQSDNLRYYKHLTRRPHAGALKPNSITPPPEVQSEMTRLHNRLSEENHPLAPLPLELATVLGARTAQGYRKRLENIFVDLRKGDPVRIVGVLAHTTALKEANPMIEAAKVMNSFLNVELRILLVHWDLLLSPTPAESFELAADSVEGLLNNTNMTTELVVVDRNAWWDIPPFIQARNEIWNPEVGTPCADDLEWTLKFYSRQNSFRPHGPEQAYRDFTMRRALGLFIADLTPDLALLTEKKERLARCYRCPCPALNVKV